MEYITWVRGQYFYQTLDWFHITYNNTVHPTVVFGIGICLYQSMLESISQIATQKLIILCNIIPHIWYEQWIYYHENMTFRKYDITAQYVVVTETFALVLQLRNSYCMRIHQLRCTGFLFEEKFIHALFQFINEQGTCIHMDSKSIEPNNMWYVIINLNMSIMTCIIQKRA